MTLNKKSKANVEISPSQMKSARPVLMGQAAGAITEVKPAAEIIHEMMTDAIAIVQKVQGKIGKAKL